MKTKDLKRTKGITLISLVVLIIVLLILAGVSIMTLAGDNGLLTRTVGAKNKTTLAVMEEELNLAYMSVYTGKAGTGAINSGVSLDEIYAAASLPSEVKSHIIQIGNANTIRLREGSSSNVTILAEDGAITSNGTPGTNTVNIEIEEVSNENVYWLESDGVYYPMSIANSRVVLDKENTSTTAPTGQVSTGNEIGITFLDSGTSEAGENSSYVTKNTSKSGNITTITLTASNAGNTEVIVKKGNGTEVGEKVGVTVTPVYTISLGTMINGSVGITTSGQNTATDTKYASGTQIVLTATGDSGYEFEKWYDNGTENTSETQASRNITINATTAAVEYKATFKEAVGYFKQDGTIAYYYPSVEATNEDRIQITNNTADIGYIGKYLGMKVDYIPGGNPIKGKASNGSEGSLGSSTIYRIFYVDVLGKYGSAGTIYLKADCDGHSATLDNLPTNSSPNIKIGLNKEWETNSIYTTNPKINMTYVNKLLDKSIWETYKDSGAIIADCVVGAPSLEMWIESYNAFLKANQPTSGTFYEYNCTVIKNDDFSNTYIVGTGNETVTRDIGPNGANDGYGYYVGTKVTSNLGIIEAYYNGSNSNGYYTANNSLVSSNNYTSIVAKDRLNTWIDSGKKCYWLASPSASYTNGIRVVRGDLGCVGTSTQNGDERFCPLVVCNSGVCIFENK